MVCRRRRRVRSVNDDATPQPAPSLTSPSPVGVVRLTITGGSKRAEVAPDKRRGASPRLTANDAASQPVAEAVSIGRERLSPLPHPCGLWGGVVVVDGAHATATATHHVLPSLTSPSPLGVGWPFARVFVPLLDLALDQVQARCPPGTGWGGEVEAMACLV